MAMAGGDAGTLMRYTTPQERSDGALSTARLQEVMDHLLTPYVRSKIPNGKLDFTNDTSGAHATSELIGKSTGTGFAALSGDVYKTEEGLQCNVLRTVLTNSWRLRFYHPEALTATRGELFRAALEGIATDRAFLEQVGLKGWVPVQPNLELRFMSWDEIVHRDQALLSNYAAG